MILNNAAAAEISARLKLNTLFSRLLVARGIDTPEKAERFIKSGIKNLHDPFLLGGMEEAAGKIEKCVAEKRPVVIYGDYDADGICSVAILYLYFKSLGVETNWYIPERDEGYGINADAVDFIAKTYNPSLFISADCGITAIDEVERIKSYGIDVIITDHHNSTGKIPDCVVINPKISPSYPFRELCGAGVALKLVQALGGADEARKYTDIAAIATVADSVELLGENRDIVSEGLKVLNNGKRAGIKKLYEYSGFKEGINTYSLAFGIVPRINAAGRIGEAKRAVALFYEEDQAALDALCKELNEANAERQRICEEILLSAKEKVAREGLLSSYAIAIIDESCHDGVSGIVASKLCEEYCRPSFVFCECEGRLKGSGRSVEGINIFDMLSGMSDLFERFGGHAYAAGLTMKKENFGEFVKRANEYLLGTISPKLFSKRRSFDMDLTGERPTIDFIEQLGLFEPCGMGNMRPRFLFKSKKLKAQPMKNYEQHLVFKLFDTNFVAFGCGPNMDILNSDTESSLLIEFQQSVFKGKVYNKGILRDLEYNVDSPALGDKIKANYLLQLGLPKEAPAAFEQYDFEDISALIGEGVKPYGTLIVAFSKAALDDVLARCPQLGQVKLSVFFPGDCNNLSRILLSPSPDIKAEGYERVIFTEAPLNLCYINRFAGSRIYLPREKARLGYGGISLDRETFARYFRMMTDKRAAARPFEGVNEYFHAVQSLFGGASLPQFAACFMVFKELGFIEVTEGRVKKNDGVRGELESSEVYRSIKALIG